MTPEEIDPTAPPSGKGCVECDQDGGWWVHLRRCAVCGHIGCCDQSPERHATAHFHASGHRYMRTFEPGESWFWDYVEEKFIIGPALAPPLSHPDDQPVPGPADRLPHNWRDLIES
ncbi:MAG: UBP-type zinc finger domain-containing protein [Microbacterium sp.]